MANEYENDPVASSPAATDPSPAAQDAASELSQLKRDRDEVYDRLLRKTAEFDNFRKRVERERRELTDWAASDVLTDVIAILDDFDRALGAPSPEEAKPFRTGVELIHRALGDLLRKRGVTAMESVGATFDPHLHQAVAYEEVGDRPDGEVVEELRKGYRIGERLLRPAMVKVAKAS